MRLTLEVEGVKEVDRGFNRLGAELSDLRPTWSGYTKPAIQRVEQEQFKSEGSKGRSGKWPPLTRNYAAWKEKRYGRKLILQRTGDLFEAMTSDTSNTLFVNEPLSMGYGTSLDYMPHVHKKRPVVSLTDSDREYIVKETQKGLLKQIRGQREIIRALEVEQ